ncbi:alpha/beta hydrolase [Parvularcula lutaonensis]|uniref:Alpha/beta hydrolase n=1 Tax=Parvularcula lutaonensis TaxID=491923 RepID=A0ABV7MCC3_9PROT|nr:alpha/beta hydrolase [Parvularcula lutaonensis]GGY50429.1 hypothetical protein GCM10007148_19040 [Parvularcula lutaonensis]
MRLFAYGGLALVLAACGGEPEAVEPPREPTREEIARAEAFLATQTPLPPGWSFETIPFEGDAFLRVGMASPEKPRATILFVPGYTSSPELASDFLARWYDLGFEVASVDLPGQGGSVRREDDYQKTYTGDFGFYGRSVDAATAYVASKRRSDGPLIVAGDSFGGHSLLRAAADGGLEEADGLLPIVPAVEPVLEAPKWLVKFFVGRDVRAGRGAEYLPGAGRWSPDAWKEFNWEYCGDREDRNFKNTAIQILRPEMRVGGASKEWGLGMVRSGEQMLKDPDLKAWSKPVQMVTAGKDVIVRNEAAERLCERGMKSCELTRIEEATHCVYLEDDPTQEKVHAALLHLLSRIEEAS